MKIAVESKRSPTAIDKAVGYRLKMMRRASLLSQEEMAAQINVSTHQMRKYETGQDRISIGRLMLIIEALQTTPSAFFEGILENDITSDSQSHDELSDLLRMWTKIKKPYVRQSILIFIKKQLESDQ